MNNLTPEQYAQLLDEYTKNLNKPASPLVNNEPQFNRDFVAEKNQAVADDRARYDPGIRGDIGQKLDYLTEVLPSEYKTAAKNSLGALGKGFVGAERPTDNTTGQQLSYDLGQWGPAIGGALSGILKKGAKQLIFKGGEKALSRAPQVVAADATIAATKKLTPGAFRAGTKAVSTGKTLANAGLGALQGASSQIPARLVMDGLAPIVSAFDQVKNEMSRFSGGGSSNEPSQTAGQPQTSEVQSALPASTPPVTAESGQTGITRDELVRRQTDALRGDRQLKPYEAGKRNFWERLDRGLNPITARKNDMQMRLENDRAQLLEESPSPEATLRIKDLDRQLESLTSDEANSKQSTRQLRGQMAHSYAPAMNEDALGQIEDQIGLPRGSFDRKRLSEMGKSDPNAGLMQLLAAMGFGGMPAGVQPGNPQVQLFPAKNEQQPAKKP